MGGLLRALAKWYLKRSHSSPTDVSEPRPAAAAGQHADGYPSKGSDSERLVIKLTSAQEEALSLAAGAEPFVFITGRAGSGKSTLIQRLKALNQVVVCAPTGIAALNCGGATLHSTFKLAPRFHDPLHPEPKVVRGLDRLKILVIDEISMVRADVLDQVHATLQYNRSKNAPFGGVKVVAVGDCRQLPPVVTEDERDAIKHRYPSPWWFDAHCMKGMPIRVVQLTQIHRQKDPELIELLDKIRTGSVDHATVARLNERVFRGPVAHENALILTARRKEAENLNRSRLDALEPPSRTYVAEETGTMVNLRDDVVPSPRNLELKEGTRVMVTKNHAGAVNGTLGTVMALLDGSVQFRADGAADNVTLTPMSWEQYRYELRAGQFVPEVTGTYKQIPLTYGWAVTIHKAQGLTLNNVCVDLGNGAFAPGQAYVALSRTRTMDGLAVRRALQQRDFMTDTRVDDFHGQHKLL